VTQSVIAPGGARRAVPVRDFASKLRITAALLGCTSQKDFCARFYQVNPGTTFDLDRSYKWMQGRAQPRSARVYEDWAALLGTSSPIAQLQSCTVDEFLDLVCDLHKVSRDALVARAGLGPAPGPQAAEPEPQDALPGRHLAGVYACYSHAWSPYFEGRLIRGTLAIEETEGASPAMLATYAESVALGRVEVRGQVTVSGRWVHIDLARPVQFRLAMNLFLPGPLASVLAGVMSGTSWVDTDPQPAATRIVMVRIPGATAAALDASNRYLDPAAEPLSGELAALGLPIAEPAELDALLAGFLAAHRPSGYLKVGADEYSRLAQAIDRLMLQHEAAQAPPVGPRAAAPARVVLREGDSATVAAAPVARAPPSPERDGRMAASLAPAGRGPKLARLQGALGEALGGERRAVLVTGEPGIGKSTLLDAFLTPLAAQADLWVARGQCPRQQGPGEPYLPVLEAFGSLCRVAGAEPVRAALKRYAPMWLAQLPALMGEAELDALQKRVAGMAPERMLRQMAEAVEALTTEHRALVLGLDDLQWSDHATLELIDMLVRRQLPARLLIVGAYRSAEVIAPDHPLLVLKQDLQLRGHCEEIALEPLSEAAVAVYFSARFAASGGTLEPSLDVLPHLVHARTGGHPLFMAAVADDLVRRGLIVQRQGHWAAAAPVQEVELPAGVQQLIGQEIERLDPAQQRMLEAASVAGLEFSAPAVAAALDADHEAIEAWGTDLVRRQRFLRPAGVDEWPDGTIAARFAFRHDLYREAVARRLGDGRRRALHLRLGNWLERAHGGRAREIAATLAVHFEEGRDHLRAARYRQYASEQALRRHAPREAIEHARRGLALIQGAPASAERARRELLLHQTLAVVLITAKSFAAPELAEVYTRAGELCNEVDDPETLVPVLCGWWNLAVNQGDLDRASAVADQLLALAERRREPVPLLQAHVVAAQTRFFIGDPVAAVRHVEDGLGLYDVEHHHQLTDVYGEDPGVVGHMLAGMAKGIAGCPDQACRHGDDGLRLSRELGYPFGIAQALSARTVIDQHCGDVDRVRERAEALIRLCREAEIALWLGSGRVLRGWALARQGRVGPGLAQLRRGLGAWRATGTAHHMVPYFLALLADALAQDGASEAALGALAEARAVAETTGERWYEAELHRLTGVVALQKGAAGEAEAAFQRAREIALRQQARSLELRAATSLARLWAAQGERRRARQLLAPVYDGFTEGFDTADLTAANALLDQLAARGPSLVWDAAGGGAGSPPTGRPADGPTSDRSGRRARS
jgi:predicted ATPase